MIIKKLIMEELEIPFKQAFGHAAAVRAVTESVLVKAISLSGETGYGEGCPRSYVTGETLLSVHDFFSEHTASISEIVNLDQLNAWARAHVDSIDKNPAAWCAIELALLDLFGREHKLTVEALLSLPELAGVFHYTAVLGTQSPASFARQLQRYTATGFSDYKIKVSGDLGEDREKITMLRDLVSSPRIRLDANNLWRDAREAITYIRELRYPLFAVEEPINTGDYAGCREIFQQLGIPVILDESFLRTRQFKEIAADPEAWVINIRVSKMGGIVRSLAIADKAKALNIPVIIGAQVGETSILTRAALTVANAYRDIVLAQEGAYGTNLLEHDITGQSIMFGPGGVLEAKSVNGGHGLGLNIE